jgi:CheY-like chemotaxis protein
MGGKLLLADDSITIQKVVELTFAETAHRVIAVGGGRELIRRLAEVQPDCVLCDVIMPDMSGYDVCRTIKSDPATLHIPVVLLTGTFEPFDRERALAVGCDAIVTKPFESRELVGVVEDLLVRAKAFGSGAQAQSAENADRARSSGIAEGVESIEFTTADFDAAGKEIKPLSPPPREDMAISAFDLGDSHPGPPLPAPPEFREPMPTAETDDFIFAPPRSTAASARATVTPVTPPPPPAAPAEERDVFASTITGFASSPMEKADAPAKSDEEVFLASAPEAPEPEPIPPEAAAPPAEPLAAPAASVPPAELPKEALEHIGARVREAFAWQPVTADGAPAGAHALSAADVDKVAQKMVELYTPQLEHIAWEIIPDVAEMLVKRRIAELEKSVEEES